MTKQETGPETLMHLLSRLCASTKNFLFCTKETHNTCNICRSYTKMTFKYKLQWSDQCSEDAGIKTVWAVSF